MKFGFIIKNLEQSQSRGLGALDAEAVLSVDQISGCFLFMILGAEILTSQESLPSLSKLALYVSVKAPWNCINKFVTISQMLKSIISFSALTPETS